MAVIGIALVGLWFPLVFLLVLVGQTEITGGLLEGSLLLGLFKDQLLSLGIGGVRVSFLYW